MYLSTLLKNLYFHFIGSAYKCLCLVLLCFLLPAYIIKHTWIQNPTLQPGSVPGSGEMEMKEEKAMRQTPWCPGDPKSMVGSYHLWYSYSFPGWEECVSRGRAAYLGSQRRLCREHDWAHTAQSICVRERSPSCFGLRIFHNHGFVMSNRKQCFQYFPPWGSLTCAKDLFSLWPQQNSIFSSLLTVLLLKDFPTLSNSSSGISSLTVACQGRVSLLSYSPSVSIAVKPGAANDAIRGKCEAHRSQCMGPSFCAYVQRWKLVIVIHRRG